MNLKNSKIINYSKIMKKIETKKIDKTILNKKHLNLNKNKYSNHKQIPFKFTNRRDGDLAIYFANPSLANEILGWKSQYNLDQMCEDTWRWQSNNPFGFPS